VSATAADLRTWLDTTRLTVEAALQRFLPADRPAPAIVVDAMRYSLFAGGKRLRPVLALAAAEAVAMRHLSDRDEAGRLALPAACALELIHTYSLVHDDLPAMDNDTLRRGRPTAHVVYGEGMAILAGDGLLTEAFALLAREPRDATSIGADELRRRKLRTLVVIADAAGAAGMVGGQALDLHAVEPGTPPLDARALNEMHARKTGALIVASAVAGAVMAGADEAETIAVDRFAAQVGLAFQIVDDILDVEGASADLGKTAGKDAAAGKPTYAALYGLDQSRAIAARCVERALEALGEAGLEGQLPALARWVVGRTS
jgi:geranylgeranyl diphosphate synthase, type II